MELSERARAAGESATLRIWTEFARLRRRGIDAVSLLEGEADLPPPPEVIAATARALRAGALRYSTSAGLPDLRRKIAAKLRRENGIPAAEENVVVCNGAKQAIFEALQALCGPGDEVLIPAPYWVTFPEAVRLAGAKPVFAGPDPESLARALTRRTRGIVLNSPNNPTGAVYGEDELRAIAALARKRDLFLLSDEAYERLVYDGRRHVSVAALSADAARRTVTIQTFSKSFSMTGFRVGYLAAEPAVAKAVARIHGHVTGNVCTFAQHGALAALGLGTDYARRRRAVFSARRDLAFAEASRLFPCARPSGGFFVFADARAYLRGPIKDSAGLAAFLLKKARVAVVPGSACGKEGFLRLSFSFAPETLREGFARIRRALGR